AVQPGAGGREDAADRVRPVRRRTSTEARSRQAGDVSVPGLHAHVREEQARTLRATARDGEEADAGEAEGDQGRAEATPTFADPRAGTVAGACGAGALRLLRGARQHEGAQHVPRPSSAALVHGASAPQPTHELGLATKKPPGVSMATTTPDPASLA